MMTCTHWWPTTVKTNGFIQQHNLDTTAGASKHNTDTALIVGLHMRVQRSLGRQNELPLKKRLGDILGSKTRAK